MSNQLAAFLNDPEARLAIKAASLRQSFGRFVKEAWKHATGFDYVHGRHIDVLVKHLEAVAAGKVSRLLVNIPPSCSKSTILSVLWPAWLWTIQPDAEIVCFSYSQALAMRDSVACRELIRSAWYQSLFPNIQATQDDDSKQFFRLVTGGRSGIPTPGATATGTHPRYTIIDDSLSVDESKSFAAREALKIWYTETLSTRGMARDVAHVVAGQRLHPDDLPGVIIKHHEELCRLYGDDASPWYIVSLPMRFVPSKVMADRGFGGDWRTEAGQLLYPELLPESKVLATERALGPFATSAQLQQDPRRSDSGMFKCSKLQKVTHSQLPKSFKGMVRGWDLAASQDTGCYTVGALLAHYHDERTESDRFYVLDVARKQTDDPISYMRDISVTDVMTWSGAKVVHESQPAVGKLLDKQIAQRLRGLSVRSVRPVGSKEDRWEPLAIALLHGELFILEGPWNAEFVDEMESAPGKFVDQLDAAALAYQSLVETTARGGFRVATAAERSTKPRESERCLTDGCDRPAFDSETGFCCDKCHSGERCSPECCNRYSDWFNSRMPTEHVPKDYRRNILQERLGR
ncbi:MAG: hypothetical protein K9M08_08485 [Pirellula sp.]|nr:hypothetical protein [Pirellula sp.]